MRALCLTYLLLSALSVMLAAQSSAAGNSSVQNDVSIQSSFDSDSGTPEMTYKDHPDLAMAACSKCGESGQVLVVTGQDVAVHDTTGKLLKRGRRGNFFSMPGLILMHGSLAQHYRRGQLETSTIHAQPMIRSLVAGSLCARVPETL